MRIAILDDRPEDVQLLVGYLDKFQAERALSFQVDTFYASLDFLEEYRGGYDVALLDIEMPGTNGLDVAHEIRAKDDAVGIVFITNMAQYAIRGYEVNAVDFMVKPVSYFNFARNLDKAIHFAQRRVERSLLLTNDDGLTRVPVSDIWYIEKNGNYAHYHTRRGEFTERGTIQTVREKLDPLAFSECTSGCLVNLRHVERIGKDTVLVGARELPLSRRMKKKFTQDYVDYVGGAF